MKRLQNFYLYSYRFTGFIFLLGLISSILWYGFSILFFLCNSSWSLPLILSPNQEKVMVHLEHVLNMEHQLEKNIAELKAAQKALSTKKAIIKNVQQLSLRVTESMTSQSLQYSKTSQIFKKLTKEKVKNLNELSRLASEIRGKEHVIDKELKVGLITKQEALAQNVILSNIHASLIDTKTKVHELSQRSKDFANAASTLKGSANNLSAIQKVIKKVELDSQIAELKIDAYNLSTTIEYLEKNIEKRRKTLTVMKNSPYILATRVSNTLAFVPYHNIKNIKVGSPIYSCFMDMIFCYQSGLITHIYQGEEYGKHPIFKSEIKGQLVAVTFNRKTDAQKKLVYLNSKPLLI